ncbi:MAG: hypothetical protein FWE67_01470 [Planctomycetaceae bacterium]|nr:hypothetical protein [Planctomycetaceae bacterium]
MRLCSLLTIVFIILLSNTVSAQLPPPISPWMNMFQSSRGNPLGNYHTYVKPQMNMMNEFRAQGAAIQRQSAQGRQLSDSVDKVLDMPRKRPSIGGQRGAGFGQHIHYYPNMRSAPVPNYSTPQVGGRVR